MKKSASAARVTRISPSAPIPRCRSHSATTSGPSMATRSSTSSIITKSLPVPLYLPNRTSSMAEVLRQLVHDRKGPVGSRVEPPDARIAAEPGQLPPRERSRPLHGAGDGVLQRLGALEVLDGFSVPYGLSRGEGRAEATAPQCGRLLQQSVIELCPNAALDAFAKDAGINEHPRRPQSAGRIPVPRHRVRG